LKPPTRKGHVKNHLALFEIKLHWLHCGPATKIAHPEPRFLFFFCPSFFGVAFLRYKKRSSALDVGWDGESGIFFPPKRWGNPPKKGEKGKTYTKCFWNTKTLL